MKDNARVYNLYGLRVHSEIALPAPIAASPVLSASEGAMPPYDLQVCWGERKAISDAAPAGEILAKLILDNGRGYTLVDTGSGYIYFFHQTGEFWIGYDLRTVRVHLSPDVHPEIAGLLVVGNVIACVLTLAGESVLHASAVEIDGAALAFLGGSGMGKSTLAALLCANGAQFITDDLLRLEPNGKGWRCFPGTGQLRLRKNSAALVENFSATMLEATPDDRIAVNLVQPLEKIAHQPEWASRSNSPENSSRAPHFRVDALTADSQSMPLLGAIVIPHPSRSCDALKLERIPRDKSLLYLMAYPRMHESAQKKQRQRRLDFLGRIAASVSIFEAQIPWGLPFPCELAESLVEGVGGHAYGFALR